MSLKAPVAAAASTSSQHKVTPRSFASKQLTQKQLEKDIAYGAINAIKPQEVTQLSWVVADGMIEKLFEELTEVWKE